MKKMHLAALLGGAMAGSVMFAPAASAQTMPMGAELRGATMQIAFADGVTNTVTFNPDGTASIQGPTDTVAGRWFVDGSRLCLQTAAGRECWPYQAPFMNGQTVTLTSDCASTSQWTALSTAQPPMQQRRPGERG